MIAGFAVTFLMYERDRLIQQRQGLCYRGRDDGSPEPFVHPRPASGGFSIN